MHGEIAIKENRDFQKRGRFWAYWISAMLSTLVFLVFTYTMSMVPGIDPGRKLWMLTIEIVLLAVPLGLGIWKFRATDAPLAAGRMHLIIGVLIILELAVCIVSVFQVAMARHV
jgi:hypothetical protein